jgi:hypothetical protein
MADASGHFHHQTITFLQQDAFVQATNASPFRSKPAFIFSIAIRTSISSSTERPWKGDKPTTSTTNISSNSSSNNSSSTKVPEPSVPFAEPAQVSRGKWRGPNPPPDPSIPVPHYLLWREPVVPKQTRATAPPAHAGALTIHHSHPIRPKQPKSRRKQRGQNPEVEEEEE